MKKLIIITGFLCFSLFAFAGEKNNFVSLSVGNSFLPAESYDYNGISAAFVYGREINSQSFGVIGFDLSYKLEGAMLFRYEYEFVSGESWLPGANIGLLVGVANKNKLDTGGYAATLGLGGDLGLFLKIGASDSRLQGVVQTGVKYFSAVSQLSKSFKEKIQHYLSLSVLVNF